MNDDNKAKEAAWKSETKLMKFSYDDFKHNAIILAVITLAPLAIRLSFSEYYGLEGALYFILAVCFITFITTRWVFTDTDSLSSWFPYSLFTGITYMDIYINDQMFKVLMNGVGVLGLVTIGLLIKCNYEKNGGSLKEAFINKVGITNAIVVSLSVLAVVVFSLVLNNGAPFWIALIPPFIYKNRALMLIPAMYMSLCVVSMMNMLDITALFWAGMFLVFTFSPIGYLKAKKTFG